MIETQKSIAGWCNNTFGPASNLTIVHRLKKELDELIESVENNSESNEILMEAADINIILRRLCGNLGVDLDSAVDQKMAINRKREWEAFGNGDGRHK